MKFKVNTTNRGYDNIEFKDRYNSNCSIQKSSLASEDAIWLGLDSSSPKVMASDASKVGIDTTETCGWVDFPIPNEVLISTRMHLTQTQVIELLPILEYFAETGELPTNLETI